MWLERNFLLRLKSFTMFFLNKQFIKINVMWLEVWFWNKIFIKFDFEIRFSYKFRLSHNFTSNYKQFKFLMLMQKIFIRFKVFPNSNQKIPELKSHLYLTGIMNELLILKFYSRYVTWVKFILACNHIIYVMTFK